MTKLTEFSVIEQFFAAPSQQFTAGSPSIELGIGDDCAILNPPPGESLLISCDSLVEGVHFFPSVKPQHLGHKTLAVNLSDLAACGAKPLAFTLAACVPQVQPQWIKDFSRGLFQLAQQHHCNIIGGDTTKGPLTLSVTIFGSCPQGQAILRSSAQPGDDIYVSGSLGDARAALEALRSKLALSAADFAYCRSRLELPTPRVELGIALRNIASAAADISDGLTGDLSHILKASRVGAEIQLDWLQAAASAALQRIAPALRQQLLLAGGDDYELLFTAPAKQRLKIQQIAQQLALPISKIGRITAGSELVLLDAQQQPVQLQAASFDHFA